MKPTIRHLAWICAVLCTAAPAQPATATYTVKPGDSLSRIARSHGCTVDALAKANGLKLSSIIQPGQSLKIPGKPSTPARQAVTGSHTIRPGDTFSSISSKYGVPVDRLLAANPGLDPKNLRPGRKILLSPQAATATPDATPEATARTTPPPADAPAANPPAPITTPPAPQTTPAAPAGEQPAGPTERIHTVSIENEMSVADFAAKHNITIERLNDLNGLDLVPGTILAKGSELYVSSSN